MSEIEEIKEIINNFAKEGQYSANNPYVKSLYKRLRELEGREQMPDDNNYEEYFIDGSDVPRYGGYE